MYVPELLSSRFADPVLTPTGQLQAQVFGVDVGVPVPNAVIRVTPREGGNTIEELISNESGQTAILDLDSPPIEYSLQPEQPRPYSEYTLDVTADGYEPMRIEGVQILSNTMAIQQIRLQPLATLSRQPITIVIDEHTLYGVFPPKIPEDEVKPLPESSGYVVLDRPVIPEIIVVHMGVPSDTTAKNYYIKFKDYITNVACSEIYATWPESTIRANVLAILSFTLNRVFTEWYRGKGKNFTITNSTAYDHAFFYGRNIYQEVSSIVDEIFTTYITRPGIRQPLFTQYCDGVRTSCPNWMTQWGSKNLGDKGLPAIDILRSFYGPDVYLTSATKVSGIPSSYPGSTLQVGSRGNNVRTIQTQLNGISNNFPAIPKQVVDGVYGNGTKAAVQAFQKVFNLPQTGVVNSATWYKISDIYVAVKKLAELV